MSDLHREKTLTSTPEQSRGDNPAKWGQFGSHTRLPAHLAWAATQPLWPIIANLTDPASIAFEE